MELSFLAPVREIGNAHHPFTVATKKAMSTGNTTVNHTPRVISSVYSVFIRQGGNIYRVQCMEQGNINLICLYEA